MGTMDETAVQLRYCPLCEETTGELTCTKHGVPTVSAAILEPNPVIANGALIGGRYRVESLLGEGGMGAVLLATQVGMDRKVAVKTLKRSMIDDASGVKRFYREARAASRLEHPNVVRVFDFGIDDVSGTPYLVMEHLTGEDLGEVLEQEGSLSEQRACTLLAQVAKALIEAHEKGIVHRDLKPDNIHVKRLRNGEEFVKVLDFGIAKVAGPDTGGQTQLTETGTSVGTPTFMSPEQIQGGKIDHRSDLYSLGCILYQLVTGAPPFTAESEDYTGVMVAHMMKPPPPLPERLLDGHPPSAALVALIDSLLAKKPKNRPATTAEVARQLARLGWGHSGEMPMPVFPGDETGPVDALIVDTGPLEMAPTLGFSTPAAAAAALGEVPLIIMPDDPAGAEEPYEAQPEAEAAPAAHLARAETAPVRSPLAEPAAAEPAVVETEAVQVPARSSAGPLLALVAVVALLVVVAYLAGLFPAAQDKGQPAASSAPPAQAQTEAQAQARATPPAQPTPPAPEPAPASAPEAPAASDPEPSLPSAAPEEAPAPAPEEAPAPALETTVSAPPESAPAPEVAPADPPGAVTQQAAGPGPGSEAAAPAPEPAAPAPEPAAPEPELQQVQLVSVPVGATVRRGSETLGKTPLTIEVPPGDPLELTLRRRGYRTARVELDASSEDTVRVTMKRSAATSGPGARPKNMGVW